MGVCNRFIARKKGGNGMKKRIRKTGEIVDVISYNKYTNTARNSELDWVSYVDSKGMEHEHEKGLNIYWDFEDVEETPDTYISWEQVRIKSAISALQGFCSNSVTFNDDDDKLAKWSVSCADALIAELKKGGEK